MFAWGSREILSQRRPETLSALPEAGSSKNRSAGLPEVKQVILFGSRARGDAGVGSDIDLAVTAPGVNLKQWFKIYDTINGLNTLLPVDLIWLEEAPDGLRSKILAEGEVLYERNEK